MKKHDVAPSVRKFTPPKASGKTTLPNTPGRQAAQAKYNSQPEQIKRRAQRNKARRIAMKEGLVRKGDGKDVDHKNGNTANESASNLRVEAASVNRHFNRRSKRTKNG
jgi:hypothetical protein